MQTNGRMGRSVRSGSARLVAALAVAGAALGGVGRADAQTSTTIASGTPQPISVVVNIPGQQPAAVTGYRADVICRNILGLSAGGALLQGLTFPVSGGSGTVTVNMQPGTNCSFRLSVLGTGPRPLNGNGVLVGGTLRGITFPTSIDGVAVEANSVVETAFIPVEAATQAVFGQPPVPTTVAPTTVAPTTVAPTTVVVTTTVPPTTVPPTTVPPTTVAPTTAPPVTVPVTTAAATTAPAKTKVPVTTKPRTATKKPLIRKNTTTTKPKTKLVSVRRCSKVGKQIICRTLRVAVKV